MMMIKIFSKTTLLVSLLLFFVSFFPIRIVQGGSSNSNIHPQISLGISQSGTNNFGTTFEPCIKWITSGKTVPGNIDYEGGVTIQGKEDGTLPYNVWGKIKKRIDNTKFCYKPWDVSARIDTSSKKLEKISYDIQAAGGRTNLKVQLKGFFDVNEQMIQLSTIKLSQSLKGFMNMGSIMKDSTITITPSYNIPNQKGDLSVSYNLQDTTIVVDANIDQQKITLSQQFGNHNAITPSITNTGEFEIEYCRAIDNNGLATVLINPKKQYMQCKYEDDKWTAVIDGPIKKYNSYTKNDIHLSIRRSI